MKKKIKKVVALIGLISSIITIYSALKNQNPNDKESRKRTEITASDNSNINDFENSSSNNVFGDNNSGNNIAGDDLNIFYAVPNDEQEQEEKIDFIGEVIGNDIGTVSNEDMYTFHGCDNIPLYGFELFNKTGIEINISNIFVEVLSFRDLNEFIIENFRYGGSIDKIIYWSCNISPKKSKYHVMLNGTDENNMDDLSKTEYVSIKASQSEKFKLKILPDTPGLYEVKIIIEYTSGENESIETENIKFIYDPKDCAKIGQNDNISINHSYIGQSKVLKKN